MSLKKRLSAIYEGVQLTMVEGIGCFCCKKIKKTAGVYSSSEKHQRLSYSHIIPVHQDTFLLADKIMAESDEEWEEAKKVNARLIEMGETPEVELQE
jgi:hypothetical protein